MTQTILSVLGFILLLALLPAGIKWLQARRSGGIPAVGANSRVISAVAVGPHQRVVTVEVGPLEARTWLVLGVTAQSISCLTTFAARVGAERGGADGAAALAAHS